MGKNLEENTKQDLVVLKFSGGKKGKSGFIHFNFTDAQILVDRNTDKIRGVLYALDNDYLNDWLKDTLDPSIKNNWDFLEEERSKKTYSYYGNVKINLTVKAKSKEDALKMLERGEGKIVGQIDYSKLDTASSFTIEEMNKESA